MSTHTDIDGRQLCDALVFDGFGSRKCWNLAKYDDGKCGVHTKRKKQRPTMKLYVAKSGSGVIEQLEAELTTKRASFYSVGRVKWFNRERIEAGEVVFTEIARDVLASTDLDALVDRLLELADIDIARAEKALKKAEDDRRRIAGELIKSKQALS